MTDSQTLLSLYARTGSESAFRDLVARYLDLVYSTAYRLVGGDAESAKDLAQTVFVALAAKARTLPPDVMLGGWLHQHTRFVAGQFMRTERRRQLRERQAAEMNALEDHSQSNLAQVAPVLDEAIGQLDPEDRNAILLRFFERKDFRGVGEALGSTEDAARKRVDRALEKLHVLLKQRGATLSLAALASYLSTEAVTAAPTGLAATISAAAVLAAAALAATATATATTSAATTATAAAAKTLALTTLQKAALATLLAAAVGTGIYEVRHTAQRGEPNPATQPDQVAQGGAAPAAEPSQPAPGGSRELPPVVPISLAKLLNPTENHQWDANRAFKAIPHGKHVFGSVEFLLEGVLQLQSTAAQDKTRNYRRRIMVPLVETNVSEAGTQILHRGTNVAAVHLLGAARFEGARECNMAQIVWHYADGSAQTTHVIYQNHLRDWIRVPYEIPAVLPYTRSKVVWRAPFPGQPGYSVRLYRFSYPNPQPGRVLQAIELVSTMQAPNLCVVGLTLDPVPLGERPDDSPNLEPTDPAPAVQIEVMVQTPDGVPIPNANVRAMTDQVSGKVPFRFQHTRATDANGIARLGYPPAQDVERLEVAVSHDQYGGRKMGWERQASDSIPANYTFKLGDGISIGGRVVDESDVPIAGASLSFTRFWSGGDPMERRGEQLDFGTRVIQSDAQGLWQVTGVAADLLDHIGIWASHPDYVGTNYSGSRGASMEEELRAGKFKVVLRHGSWLAGRVMDEGGDPIAGATITAGKYNYSGTQEAKSDARGAFGFRNLNPGTIQFGVLAKGYKPEVRMVEVKPGMPEILFRLGRGLKVWGLVKAEAGEAVAGVRIALESKNGGVSDTYQLNLSSGRDGRFEWDGAPDEAQNFCFLKSGYEAKRQQTLKPNEENVITLRRCRKIEGQVVDATTEQPVTKFRVGFGRSSSADSFYADYPGMKDYADANGRFTLSLSEEETRAVKVEADDYAAQVELLPEAQNGVVQVVVRLKPSAALRGILVTAEGAPVAGAKVGISSDIAPSIALMLQDGRLRELGGQGKMVTTDSDGGFVLPSPSESGMVIAAQEKGFASAPVQQVRDSRRLVLQAFGRIEGTFTRRGQPVAGQELTLTMRDAGIVFDSGQYKATTDENGRFAIDRVPPGKIQVMRMVKTSENSSSYSYGAEVTVPPGQIAHLALGDSGATLTGQIRFETPPAEEEKLDLQGSLYTVPPPLPGSTSAEESSAYYQTPEGKARIRQRRTFVVGIAGDGSWNVDSVPPGTYRITVRASKSGARPWENPPVAIGTVQVVVPEGATPQTQIAVEEVVLRPVGERVEQAVRHP